MQVLVSVILLGVLVTFHEFGHFVAGKIAGVHIHEFSIGFGPVVFYVVKNGIRYSFRLIPLGGFVRFAGEEGPDRDEDESVPKEKMYNRLSPWKKALIGFAGPFMNFIVAGICFFVMFTFIGQAQATTRVQSLLPGYPAEIQGLKTGDKVLAIDGLPLAGWDEFITIVQSRAGVPTRFTVERDGTVMDFDVTPVEQNGVGVVGITPEVIFVKESMFRGLFLSIKQTLMFPVAFLSGLVQMISGRIPAEISGPVGIIQVLGEAVRLGPAYLVTLSGLISANLGMFQLLPIPALDGSKILFAGYEALRGRPVDPQKENFIHFVGFLLLMGLILFVTYKDILRLFGRV